MKITTSPGATTAYYKTIPGVYLADEEYLVTALVPSEIACLDNSPGRMSRTAVWISRDEMVDRWLYEASFEASLAIRSKMSETNELRMAMALLLGR